jgi:hypothetical protein
MRELGVIGPSRLRSASIVLALVGGIAQLAIAFMGFAIGGPGVSVWLLVGDGALATAGAVAIVRWPTVGAACVLLSGAGALAAFFSTTYLEIGPAVLLIGAGALALATRRVS